MSDEVRQSDPAGEKPTLTLADDEISAEARAAIMRLMREMDRLRAEIVANHRRIAHLEEIADRDPLTPTVNRRAFVRELERAKAYVDRYKTPACVIYLDVDGMKAINDRFGHAAGDEVLVAVARTLVGNVRASDIVGRLGGDEFAVILSHADRRAAEEKAVALTRLIDDIRIDRGSDSCRVSATWGVEMLAGAESAAAALEAADRAMYSRKRRADESGA